MRKIEDYIGKKIHHLTILEDLGVEKERRKILVQCDCERKTVKTIYFSSLFKNPPTKSCGCVKMRNVINSGLTHGMSYTREHKCWAKMKSRCYDKNNNRYDRYGGRGIIVCDSWKNSFEKFIEDMGASPSPKHTIDRVNTDGNYEPANCRWATPKEQANNASYNRIIKFGGRAQTLTQWAEELCIGRTTIAARIDQYGWSVERALTTPVVKGRSRVDTSI
jgi:hypothetical protein